MLLHGSKKMKKREAMFEHPFGTIKRALNSGYTLLKGKKKVNGEFGLIALAYNMKRVINIRSGENRTDTTEHIMNMTLSQYIPA